MVIVNKKSKDPAIVIVNNETEQLEFVQRGTLSKEIDLAIGDKKPVHFIVKPRKVKEITWDNVKYGTKKWIGI